MSVAVRKGPKWCPTLSPFFPSCRTAVVRALVATPQTCGRVKRAALLHVRTVGHVTYSARRRSKNRKRRLDCASLPSHELSHARAPRNQIPTVENAGHDRFALRRMAGLLAGWLDQGSPVIPGYASARQRTRSEVNTLWMPPSRSLNDL